MYEIRTKCLKLRVPLLMYEIRPAMLYGKECWAVKHQHVHQMGVAEMRMLRWMCGHTRNDKIKNEDFRGKVGVAEIEGKMRENRYDGLDMCKEGLLTLRLEDATTGQRSRAEGVEEDLGKHWKRL